MGRHSLIKDKRRKAPTMILGAVLAGGLLTGAGSAIAAPGEDDTETAPTSLSAAPDDNESASQEVTLAEFNNSGISGSATYGAEQVTATATGMDPNKEYYSYYYGAGSDSTGANPCILTGETAAGPNNTIGEWEVDEQGNGTLSGTSFGPPETAGTMSIRENDLGLNGNAGPNPADTLVACGEVGPEQNTPLGDVQDQVPQLPNGDDPLNQGGGDVTENPVDTDAVPGVGGQTSLSDLMSAGIVDGDNVSTDDTDDDGQTDGEELTAVQN